MDINNISMEVFSEWVNIASDKYHIRKQFDTVEIDLPQTNINQQIMSEYVVASAYHFLGQTLKESLQSTRRWDLNRLDMSWYLNKKHEHDIPFVIAEFDFDFAALAEPTKEEVAPASKSEESIPVFTIGELADAPTTDDDDDDEEVLDWDTCVESITAYADNARVMKRVQKGSKLDRTIELVTTQEIEKYRHTRRFNDLLNQMQGALDILARLVS